MKRKYLKEDWSVRYKNGDYVAEINNDVYEDPSFEDEYLPMDFVIRKNGKAITTIRGLGKAKKYIDELVEKDGSEQMAIEHPIFDKWGVALWREFYLLSKSAAKFLKSLAPGWTVSDVIDYFEDEIYGINDPKALLATRLLFDTKESAVAFCKQYKLLDISNELVYKEFGETWHTAPEELVIPLTHEDALVRISDHEGNIILEWPSDYSVTPMSKVKDYLDAALRQVELNESVEDKTDSFDTWENLWD